MAKTATTRGKVTVGEAGAVPLIEVTLASTTPTITDQQSGQKVIAASATDNQLDMGGVSNATLVHLRFFDESTGDPVRCGVRLTTSGTGPLIPEALEFLFTTDDTANGITAIFLNTISGNSTRVDYAIAGT